MTLSLPTAHNNPVRLAALRRFGLLDTPSEEAFDRLTRQACRVMRAPVALVSLVDEHRQFFKSCVGLPQPWASLRETPLSHSFCQHTITSREPLVISDARTHPLVQANLAIRDLSVIAYLGVPLVTAGGHALGALCVIDSKPRIWRADEIATMQDLAEAVMIEIELRATLEERKAAEQMMRRGQERMASRILAHSSDLQQMTNRLNTLLVEQQRSEETRRVLEHKLAKSQKLESLGVLAGGVAHDFNNLLTVIIGNVGLALMDLDEDSPAFQCIADIGKAAQHATDLTRQLMTFSGSERSRPETIDLNAVVRGMREILQPHLDSTIRLRTQLDDFLPSISADPCQIRQVVMNLITNAAEAMGDAEGRITISTGLSTIDCGHPSSCTLESDCVPGTYVYVKVTDTGCGIDEQTRANIFDPFFTTKVKGRGLGLATVLGIVRHHKGMLEVESEVGKGSTFTVFLPCEAALAPIETSIHRIMTACNCN